MTCGRYFAAIMPTRVFGEMSTSLSVLSPESGIEGEVPEAPLPQARTV